MQSTLNLRKRNVILYHHPCPDGLAAGSELYRYLTSIGDSDIDFLGHDSTSTLKLEEFIDPKLDKETQGTLWLVDYVPVDKEWLTHAFRAFTSIWIVDHHPSAKDVIHVVLSENMASDRIDFDLMTTPNFTLCDDSGARSACIIVRDYIVGQGYIPPTGYQPQILEYIDEVDRAVHPPVLKDVKAWKAGFQTYYPKERHPNPHNFYLIDFKTVMREGRFQLEQNEEYIKEFLSGETLKQGHILNVSIPTGGWTQVMAVYTIHWEIISDLGERLAEICKLPVFVITPGIPVEGQPETLRISIRCPKPTPTYSGPTPLEIAKYPQHPKGGGGRGAAGFAMPREDFEKLYTPISEIMKPVDKAEVLPPSHSDKEEPKHDHNACCGMFPLGLASEIAQLVKSGEGSFAPGGSPPPKQRQAGPSYQKRLASTERIKEAMTDPMYRDFINKYGEIIGTNMDGTKVVLGASPSGQPVEMVLPPFILKYMHKAGYIPEQIDLGSRRPDEPNPKPKPELPQRRVILPPKKPDDAPVPGAWQELPTGWLQAPLPADAPNHHDDDDAISSDSAEDTTGDSYDGEYETVT